MIELNQNYVPQIICLAVQFLLTGASIIRILDNRQQFPIRQLGPYSSIFCALCFFLANAINLIGRIIYRKNQFSNGCAFYGNSMSNFMVVLAVLFNIARQLPFALFAIKTLRVSLCFWPKFNKINVEDISNKFVSLLKHESYFTYACVVYVCLVNFLAIVDDPAALSYQFFCPKTFSIIDQVVSGVRLLALGFVYYLSVWTYSELDFKKLLLLIFLSSNLSIIPRIFIVFTGDQQKNKRDAIYFTTFLIEILNSCIIMYYSGINKKLNQPAMQGVLQSWQAFHNLRLGMDVLYKYAQYVDNNSGNNVRYLNQFDYLDELLKQLNMKNNLDFKQELKNVEDILTDNELLKEKLGTVTVNQYIKQCDAGTMTVQNIKKIQKILSNYCEQIIFAGWKKTKSFRFLKQEFINNGDINEKLWLFGIPIS